VGTAAIDRWLRGVAFQDMEDAMLPPELQESNPTGIARRVDGEWVAAQ
jgi:NADP-dependent aldehyde dehydrogenase